MPKRLDVGRSERTPAKHAAMCGQYGSEIGVIRESPMHQDRQRHTWLDLSAGDGVTPAGLPWHSNCSPGINAYYAIRASRPVDITLYEIKPATFQRLVGSLAEHLPPLGYEQVSDTTWVHGTRIELRAILGDGTRASVDHIQRTDAVLVSNDPNAMTDWAMRPTFSTEIARRTWCYRSICTMGCNVAGLLRSDLESVRAQWFDHVDRQVAALPRYRDALLARIEGDSSKWGYLFCEPTKWRTKVESVVKTAFKKYGYEMKMSWRRVDPAGFEDRMGELFLTRREREELRCREPGAS